MTDFQIFLTDGDNNTYTGKVSDGSGAAQSYWNAENLKNGDVLEVNGFSIKEGKTSPPKR